MIDARGGFANAAHVALFYAYGEYYEWSCRAAGVRRAFTGAYAGEERPSYAVLGAFVAFQLAVVAFENASALARAGRASSESRASSSATRESTSPCYEADGTRAADAPIERDVAIIERDVFGRVVGDTDRSPVVIHRVTARRRKVRALSLVEARARRDAVRPRLLLAMHRRMDE